MKTKIFVNDWIDQVLRNTGSEADSIHFDSLKECDYQHEIGFELISKALEVINDVKNHINGFESNSLELTTVVFLPLDVSDEILLWKEELWESVGTAKEPPSLYLIKGGQIFDDDMEEYRRPISMPAHGHGTVRAIFRSFRDAESMKNLWEFTSGIYLSVHVDRGS